ncbi:MAG: hypothetical protein ACI8P9_003261 [Parasphingorhabdus sp.]|jgi:hypothetical protein
MFKTILSTPDTIEAMAMHFVSMKRSWSKRDYCRCAQGAGILCGLVVHRYAILGNGRPGKLLKNIVFKIPLSF